MASFQQFLDGKPVISLPLGEMGESKAAAQLKLKARLAEVAKHQAVPLAWILSSKPLQAQMEKVLEKTPKYRHEMGDGDQVAFHMIGDDIKEVHKQIGSIWHNKPYFICINDN